MENLAKCIQQSVGHERFKFGLIYEKKKDHGISRAVEFLIMQDYKLVVYT